MSRHEVLGELDSAKLAVLRMTLIRADADEWFTPRDVALPLGEVTTERAIRDLYGAMVQGGFMDLPIESGGVTKYRLTQRGITVLEALLRP